MAGGDRTNCIYTIFVMLPQYIAIRHMRFLLSKEKKTHASGREKWLCNETNEMDEQGHAKSKTNQRQKKKRRKKILYNLTETILIECIQMRILYPH